MTAKVGPGSPGFLDFEVTCYILVFWGANGARVMIFSRWVFGVFQSGEAQLPSPAHDFSGPAMWTAPRSGSSPGVFATAVKQGMF